MTKLRAAAAELLALKDIDDRLNNPALSNAAWEELAEDYARRKPLAWAALRAALAEPLTESADNDYPWLVYKYTRAALAEPQAEPRNDCGEKSDPDVADIIAGALQTSRGHAYELMREACTSAQAGLIVEGFNEQWVGADPAGDPVRVLGEPGPVAQSEPQPVEVPEMADEQILSLPCGQCDSSEEFLLRFARAIIAERDAMWRDALRPGKEAT